MGASSMRGVYVLFEGLPPTVIDSQVLTHVRFAREQLGIDMVVIVFACDDALFKMSAGRLDRAKEIAGGPVHLLRGVRPALPGSMMVNRKRLRAALDAIGPFVFIHARTDYSAAVSGPIARRRNIQMLWDCRGDAQAELRERLSGIAPPLQSLVSLREVLARRETRMAGSYCSAANFVSKQLRELMRELIGSKPSWIVPCLAPEDEFFSDATLRNRMRAEMEIAADEIVYVYSGSLAVYQCFDEMVAAFQRLMTAGRRARLIVLTPELEAARKKLAGLPPANVICKSTDYAGVNGYLNASDFGFLLRDPTAVNRVAFPTKFAEYSLAGLKVVMKADPPSCVESAVSLGNYVPFDQLERLCNAPEKISERTRIAEAAAMLLGRRAGMKAFGDIYRTLVNERAAHREIT